MTNELMTTNNNSNNGVYCSIHPTTNADKVKLFNALENCTGKIVDLKDQIVVIKDVYINEYEQEDKVTHEPRRKHRTIIFDNRGNSYVTVSEYFYVTLSKIMAIWGEPHEWGEGGLTVHIIRKAVKNGEALTMEILNSEND